MPALPAAIYWAGAVLWTTACAIDLYGAFKRKKITEVDLETALARLQAAKREHLRNVK